MAVQANVAVRRLRRADLDAFAAWGRYDDPLFRHYDPRGLAAAEADELWAELAGSPAGFRAYAGLWEGRFVASLVARDVDTAAGRAEVGIVVAPEAVGRGLGPRLLDALAAELARDGIRRLGLEVAAFNRRAVAAYVRACYAVVAERWGPPEPGVDLDALLQGPAAAAVRPHVRSEAGGPAVRILRMERPADPEALSPLTTSIELIALDLDGTLLSPDDRVSPANRGAIARSLAAGIRIVLVTGRGADTALQIARDLGLDVPVICAHGALTKDVAAGRTLAHVPVPLEHARTIVAFAETHGHALALYHEEKFWRRAGSDAFLNDMNGPGWHQAPSLLDVLTTAPTFMRFLGRASVEALTERFGALPLNFRYETWGDFLECAVLDRSAGKRDALASLCGRLGIPAERVLAIGDSRNDVPMLHWAGIGVAMGNALPEVKAAVVHVTAANDRDGVAAAIERFCFAAEKKSA